MARYRRVPWSGVVTGGVVLFPTDLQWAAGSGGSVPEGAVEWCCDGRLFPTDLQWAAGSGGSVPEGAVEWCCDGRCCIVSDRPAVGGRLGWLGTGGCRGVVL